MSDWLEKLEREFQAFVGRKLGPDRKYDDLAPNEKEALISQWEQHKRKEIDRQEASSLERRKRMELGFVDDIYQLLNIEGVTLHLVREAFAAALSAKGAPPLMVIRGYLVNSVSVRKMHNELCAFSQRKSQGGRNGQA